MTAPPVPDSMSFVWTWTFGSKKKSFVNFKERSFLSYERAIYGTTDLLMFHMRRQAGHQELAERLVEIQYELTDRLTFYLCGRRPGKEKLLPGISWKDLCCWFSVALSHRCSCSRPQERATFHHPTDGRQVLRWVTHFPHTMYRKMYSDWWRQWSTGYYYYRSWLINVQF